MLNKKTTLTLIKKCRNGATFKPTETQRLIVACLIEAGIPHKTVCRHRLINCCLSTFKKVFANELANAKPIADQEIVLSAYRQAKSGKVPAMTMFWLKCRCNWQEKQETPPPTNIPELKITIETAPPPDDETKV